MSAIDCLVIVAHMDDESISCGGLILDRLARGQRVMVRTVFGRKYNYGVGEQHKAQQLQDHLNALSVLGVTEHGWMLLEEGEPSQQSYYEVLRQLESDLHVCSPREVVVHDPQDRNQDHQWLSKVCQIALRPWAWPSVERILMCQGLDGQTHDANWFVPLTRSMVHRKQEAVAQYAQEARTDPHPRSPQNIGAWMRVHGSMCGHQWAEPYRLYYGRG
jgi:LmbE family N-acetylglucosaminyl deacetylase